MPNLLRVMHIKHFMAKSIAGKFHIKYNMVTGRPVLLPHRQLRLLGRPVLFLYTFLKHKHMDEYLKIFFHVLVLFTPYSFPWPVHLFSFLSFFLFVLAHIFFFPFIWESIQFYLLPRCGSSSFSRGGYLFSPILFSPI